MTKKIRRIIGVSALIIGTLIFIYLGAISVWGEIEASFFNAMLRSDEPLDALRCPTVITTNEIGAVYGEFYNSFDRTAEMEIRTYISDGYVTLMNEVINNFTLPPGETEIVKVQFTADDAAYDRLVMVRMHQMKRRPFPYRNASCGIVVVNLPFLTGSQFLIAMISLGVALSAGGISLWALNARPIVWRRRRAFWAMVIFSITALIITITSLLDQWLLAIILLVIWILMGISMLWLLDFFSGKKLIDEGMNDEGDKKNV